MAIRLCCWTREPVSVGDHGGPGLPEDTLASLLAESFLMNEARPWGPGMGMLITKGVAHRAGWSIEYAVLEPTGLEVRIEGPTIAEAPIA